MNIRFRDIDVSFPDDMEKGEALDILMEIVVKNRDKIIYNAVISSPDLLSKFG